jgi:hypothetical protein
MIKHAHSYVKNFLIFLIFDVEMLNYTVLSCNTTLQEYLYINLDRNFLKNSCPQLLIDINSECMRYGYERIMVNLSNFKNPLSVAVVFQACTSPNTIELLPFRLAWINDDIDWIKNWKHLELVMRKRELPWRSFSDPKSAEQ